MMVSCRLELKYVWQIFFFSECVIPSELSQPTFINTCEAQPNLSPTRSNTLKIDSQILLTLY
jgi:hypothetical protein